MVEILQVQVNTLSFEVLARNYITVISLLTPRYQLLHAAAAGGQCPFARTLNKTLVPTRIR